MNGQHGFLVGILPFVEQQAVWEMISNPLAQGVAAVPAPAFPAFGPTPALNWAAGNRSAYNYIPYMTSFPTYRCPSDPGVGLPSQGRTRYATSLGDGIHRVSSGMSFNEFDGVFDDTNTAQDVRASLRGAFVPFLAIRFRDILDGTANTICAGEIASDLGDRDTRTVPAVNPSVAANAINTGDIDACDGMIDLAFPASSGLAGCAGLGFIVIAE